MEIEIRTIIANSRDVFSTLERVFDSRDQISWECAGTVARIGAQQSLSIIVGKQPSSLSWLIDLGKADINANSKLSILWFAKTVSIPAPCCRFFYSSNLTSIYNSVG